MRRESDFPQLPVDKLWETVDNLIRHDLQLPVEASDCGFPPHCGCVQVTQNRACTRLNKHNI